MHNLSDLFPRNMLRNIIPGKIQLFPPRFLPLLFVGGISIALSACNTVQPTQSVPTVTPVAISASAEPVQANANIKAGKVESGKTESGKAGSGKIEPGTIEPGTIEPGTIEHSAPVNKTTAITSGGSLNEKLLYNLLAAEFAGNAGDVQASVNFYQKAAQQTSDKRIVARAAYVALYGKDYKETLRAINRWDKLAPGSEDVERMYAITYLKLHQPEKAIPYIQKMLSVAGMKEKEKVLALKALLAKEASSGDALIVLQKLNQTGAKSDYMLVLQARYEAQSKHYDKALSLLDQVYQHDKSMIDVLIIKARIFAAQGKNNAAVLQIEQVLNKRPNNDILRLQYAQMLVELRKLKLAKAQYEILNKHLPDNSEIILSLALINIDSGKLDEAAKELNNLIDMGKRTTVAHYYLGRIAQNKGNEKRAMSYYMRVKEGNYAFDSQLRIATLLSTLGKPDEGLKKLEAMASVQTSWPLRVRIYLTEGEILRSQKRYAEAVKMYTRALQKKHDDSSLLYARGLMAERIGRLDMTESDLRKVISQEPNNANALNALGYTLADRTRRYKEALKYIQRASSLLPDDPAILDSLGWVNFRLGRMEEAEKWLSRAFKKLADPEIAAHYGEVLWVRNKKQQAVKIWEKGKKANASNPVLLETMKRLDPGLVKQ